MTQQTGAIQWGSALLQCNSPRCGRSEREGRKWPWHKWPAALRNRQWPVVPGNNSQSRMKNRTRKGTENNACQRLRVMLTEKTMSELTVRPRYLLLRNWRSSVATKRVPMMRMTQKSAVLGSLVNSVTLSSKCEMRSRVSLRTPDSGGIKYVMMWSGESRLRLRISEPLSARRTRVLLRSAQYSSTVSRGCA